MDALSASQSSPTMAEWSLWWNEANNWRARALDHFTKVEAAIGETLLALAGIPERGAAVSFPHLAGQRLAVLRKVLADGGPFEKAGAATIKALDDFFQHEELRAMLCHGTAHVTVDHKGHWHLVMRLLAFRAGKPYREVFVVDEIEAAARLKMLHQSRQRLCAQLERLRQAAK